MDVSHFNYFFSKIPISNLLAKTAALTLSLYRMKFYWGGGGGRGSEKTYSHYIEETMVLNLTNIYS